MKNTETKTHSSLTNFRGCDCLGAVNKLSGSGNCPNVNGEWAQIEKKKRVLAKRVGYNTQSSRILPTHLFVPAHLRKAPAGDDGWRAVEIRVMLTVPGRTAPSPNFDSRASKTKKQRIKATCEEEEEGSDTKLASCRKARRCGTDEGRTQARTRALFGNGQKTKPSKYHAQK